MSNEDPMLLAARDVLASALTAIRGCVETASAEALNWRPGGDDTSSIAVLAVHSLASTRGWLARATAAPRPYRHRDDEFAVVAADAQSVLVIFDEIARDCTALLAHPVSVDWNAILPDVERIPDGMQLRTAPAPPARDSPEAVLAGWALIHALEHLREHEGQMSLTRQLWDQRA